MDIQKPPGIEVILEEGRAGHGKDGVFPLGAGKIVITTKGAEGEGGEPLRINAISGPTEAEIVEGEPAVVRCTDAAGAEAFRAIVLLRCACGRLHPVDGGGYTAEGRWQVPGEDEPYDPGTS